MTRLLIPLLIFVFSTTFLWALLYNAPGWDPDDPTTPSWQLPKQFDNFTSLAEKFQAYQRDNFAYVTTAFICIYLYKQTFAIPGSFFLVS
uniref:Phospholipid carrier-dependent glycosyltransferase n=1 Tax=Steinernema glaseri TaxID=37863 RepID=A0A1I8AGH2_9BILA